MQTRSWKIVILIGIFKFLKSIVLFAAGLGLHSLIGKDANEVLTWLAGSLRIDADNHYLQRLIDSISFLSPHKMWLLSIAAFVYATIFLIEGIGLILRKHWAEVLTVIVTGSFIPLEVYELIDRFTIMRVGTLTVNLIILLYLILRLRSENTSSKHHTTMKANSTVPIGTDGFLVKRTK